MTPAPVTAVMLGAGNRGGDVYGAWALANSTELRVTAVADADPAKRATFALAHDLPPQARFADWRDLLAQPRLANAAIIALPDREHEDAATHALRAGYHVLLEKPIAPTPAGTARVVTAARESHRVLMLGYVLRYTPFFQTVRSAVRSGRLGEVVTMTWRENVHALHYAHSYVRGNWAREQDSSPMLLAKASHDLDLIGWITDLRATRVSSFGNLYHFRAEHAPPRAPARCLDGCPHADTCVFYAPRVYLTEHAGWPASVISSDPSLAAREAALRAGPYGQCVYHAANDVVDHQVVTFEFHTGATGTLTVHGHSGTEGRTLRIDGTRATLRGTFTQATQEITIEEHDPASFRGQREPQVVPVSAPSGMAGGGHGGGDAGLMRAFVHAVRTGAAQALDLEVESHALAFAAEAARRGGTVVSVHANAAGQRGAEP